MRWFSESLFLSFLRLSDILLCPKLPVFAYFFNVIVTSGSTLEVQFDSLPSVLALFRLTPQPARLFSSSSVSCTETTGIFSIFWRWFLWGKHARLYELLYFLSGAFLESEAEVEGALLKLCYLSKILLTLESTWLLILDTGSKILFLDDYLRSLTYWSGSIFQEILLFSFSFGFEGVDTLIFYSSLLLAFLNVFLKTSSSVSVGLCSQLYVSRVSSFNMAISCFFKRSKVSDAKASPSTRALTNSRVLKSDHRNLSSYSHRYLPIRYIAANATEKSKFYSPWMRTDSPLYFASVIISTISWRSLGGHVIWG